MHFMKKSSNCNSKNDTDLEMGLDMLSPNIYNIDNKRTNFLSDENHPKFSKNHLLINVVRLSQDFHSRISKFGDKF